LIAGDVGDRGGGWHGQLKKHMKRWSASANSTWSTGMDQRDVIEIRLAIPRLSLSIPPI
jgi:hypothetical protein